MQNKIVVVFGKKGSGKTQFVKTHLQPQFNKLIIVDTLGEYTDGVLIESLTDLLAYLVNNFSKPYKIIFRQTNEIRKDLPSVSVFSLAWCAVGSTVIIEELDYYCSAVKQHYDVERIIRYGRHQYLNILGISRRAAEVPRTITSQADLIVSFRQQEPRDIQYLSQLTCPDYAEALKELPDFVPLVYAFNDKAVVELGLETYLFKKEVKENGVCRQSEEGQPV